MIREFVERENKQILENIFNAVKKIFPIKTNRGEIRLVNVKYKTIDDYTDYSLILEKKKKKDTLKATLYGDFLIIQDGKKTLIKNSKIADVPLITVNGTFLVDGTEYFLPIQIRRKPACYVVRRKGGNFEVQINSKIGFNYTITQSPEGIFYIETDVIKERLYPILQAYDIPDEVLEKYWGKDVLEANKVSDIKPYIKRFYKAVFQKEEDDLNMIKQAIKEHFKNSDLSPEVNQQTIGRSKKQIDEELLLLATQKLIKVRKGEIEPDNPNNITFKTFHTPSDLMGERLLTKDAIKTITQKYSARLMLEPKMILTQKYINQYLKGIFTTDLSHVADTTNSLGALAAITFTTPLGLGGISDPQLMPVEGRFVDDSQMGIIDPIFTPENEKVGLSLHLSPFVRIKNREAFIPVLAPDGRQLVLRAVDLLKAKIGFPDDFDENLRPKSKKVRARHGYKIVEVSPKEIDFIFPTTLSLFSPISWLIPLKNYNNPQRLSIGAKNFPYVLPLKEPDIPLVSAAEGKESLEELIGKELAITSPEDGVIQKITDKYIYLKTKDKGVIKISLPKDFVLAEDSFLTTKRIYVKPGMKVSKGDILADTNFTQKGILAIGKNLKVGYMPYKGYTNKDAIVISESAAKKLTSEHIYRIIVPKTIHSVFSKKLFNIYFPGLVSKDTLEKLDDKGIVKKGTIIMPNEPLVLKLEKKIPTPDEIILGKLEKSFIKNYENRAEVWTKDVPGEVFDIIERDNEIEIQVKTEEPARVGDKLVGRYGNKGVISLILPDEEMPKDEKGEPLEILISPASIVTRMNPGQLIESLLGKLAIKKGQIKVPHFGFIDLDKVLKQLEKEGIKEYEAIQVDGNKVDRILVGYQYFYKMKQQAEKGFSTRIPEQGYDFNLRPLTGSEGGAKALDLLTIYALLAHNSRAFLKEALTYKAEFNPEFWKAIYNNLPIPQAKPTFVFEKLKSYLNILGLSLERNNNQLYLLPLTDKEIEEKFPQKLDPLLAPLTLKKKKFELIPLKGGLYDPFIFGGLYGTKQAHLPLKVPIPNPFFVDQISFLADISENDLRKLLKNEKIDKFKDYNEFLNYFKNFDIASKIQELSNKLNVEKNLTLKNKYYRTLSFLNNLKKFNKDLFSTLFLSKVPIIPPIMRPVYLSEQGKLIESDLNVLYKRIALANQKLFELGEEIVPEMKLELFDSIRELQGLGTSLYSKHGIMKILIGGGGGESYFQRLLLSKPQELSGRAIITMDPKLRLDEIGIPEEMAFKLYSPFLIAEMKKMGLSLEEAKKIIEEKGELAKRLLEQEIKRRPVLVNRSPSLHKFSILAFYPKLVVGKTIRLHPLVTKGFNADFDGDAMQVFVPVTKEAVRDAFKMLPSQNIFKPGPDTPILLPEEDTLLGLYLISSPKGRVKKIYRTIKEIQEDLEKKEINLITPIEFKGKKMTAGLALIYNEILPLKDIKLKLPLTLDTVRDFLSDVAKKHPEKTKDIYDLLQKIGDEASIFMPSIIVSDLIKPGNIDEKIESIEPVKIFLESKARGSKRQFQELLSEIGPKLDNWGNLLSIKGSYGKGLSLADWWKTLYQARSGLISRVVLIRKPGELAKSMLISTADKLIRSKGEDIGLEMSVDNPDIIGRFLMEDIRIDGKKIPKMTLIDEKLIRDLKKHNINVVRVGSPLTGVAKEGNGIPYFSFGLDERGQIIEPGKNIGIIASHAITEPLSQTTLNILKAPGTLGDLQTLERIFNMPEESPDYEIYAPIDGVVKNIKTEKGFYRVYIDSIVVDVPIFKKLLVKKGDKVEAGMPIAPGIFNPREYARIKGVLEARKKLTQTIKNILQEGFSIPIKDRYIEVIVRAMTDYGKVIKSDKPGILPLDIMPLTELEKINKFKEQEIDLLSEPEKAIGTVLAERVAGILPNVIIDEKVLERIRKLKPKIKVKVPEIRYEPHFKGFNLLPLLKEDLFVRASHGFIHKSLKDAVLLGIPSNIHSQHPIPGLIYGAEFSIMDDEEEY